MTLQAACWWCLGVFLLVLGFGAVIEWMNKRRESDGKRIRDLWRENCKLRAQLKHNNFESEWEVDAIRTELAIKDLLLKQKWAGVKR